MTGATDEDRGTYVARLYDACGARLYRYALMILTDAEDAGDVVQQVFTALVADSSLELTQPERYLWRAVRNTAFSVLRRHRTVRNVEERRLLVPVHASCSREEQIALERALCELPPDQREVVHLHVYEGMTFREIGETTAESINTVAARYRYALARMRQILE